MNKQKNHGLTGIVKAIQCEVCEALDLPNCPQHSPIWGFAIDSIARVIQEREFYKNEVRRLEKELTEAVARRYRNGQQGKINRGTKTAP